MDGPLEGCVKLWLKIILENLGQKIVLTDSLNFLWTILNEKNQNDNMKTESIRASLSKQ